MAEGEIPHLRVDKWLWHARFFKTRSQAAAFCESGRLRINRRIIGKPSATVRIGDVLTFARGSDVAVVKVTALAVRRGPPAGARALYSALAESGDARGARSS